MYNLGLWCFTASIIPDNETPEEKAERIKREAEAEKQRLSELKIRLEQQRVYAEQRRREAELEGPGFRRPSKKEEAARLKDKKDRKRSRLAKTGPRAKKFDPVAAAEREKERNERNAK